MKQTTRVTSIRGVNRTEAKENKPSGNEPVGYFIG